MSDPDWNNGFYGDTPPIHGLRQFVRVYAGWGFSEPFYRKEVFKSAFGARSLEDFIETFWKAFFIKCDAKNLLAPGPGRTTTSLRIRASEGIWKRRSPRSGSCAPKSWGLGGLRRAGCVRPTCSASTAGK
jgi:hypothetical protein